MSEKIKNLFTDISPTYDRLNHFLSFNIDKFWRKQTIGKILKNHHDTFRVLDVCAGTHDLGIEVLRQFPNAEVTGLDFSPGMLASGEKKITRLGLASKIKSVQGDALALPFTKECFDVVICAYGVRNLDDLKKGLTEFHRVLKPGGQVLILEFFKPTSFWSQLFNKTYAEHILPRVGKIVSGNKSAYEYLRDSIRGFVSSQEFIHLAQDQGFQSLSKQDFFMNISTCVSAFKRIPS